MDYKVFNRTVYRHKLDWILYDVKSLYVKHCFVSKNCNASDHQYCVADFAFGSKDATKFLSRRRAPLPLFNKIVLWADDKLKSYQ